MKRRLVITTVLMLLAGAGIAWHLRATGRLGLAVNYLHTLLTRPRFPIAEPQENDPNPIKLGICASIGKRLFPDDNPWNQDISKKPIDPGSEQIVHRIGRDKPLYPDFGSFYRGAPNGIPYIVVGGDQPKAPIEFTRYGAQSDPGPYPIPPDAPIEGGPTSKGDRHVCVLDRDREMLYELLDAAPKPGGGWTAASGAVFDLRSNQLRPDGWTSADAAGLPILPGLVRYHEVRVKKEIDHALRFTVARTRNAYVPPATHFASAHDDVDLPPMGMRFRLRADYDLNAFSEECQVILRCLQKHGMILADNGGDWFVSGAPDPRWNDFHLHELKRVKGSDFEVLRAE